MDIELATAIVNWHVAPFALVFPIDEKLIHELSEGEAALLEDACLAILGKDHV